MSSIDRWGDDQWRARWRDPEGKSRSKVFERKEDARQHLTAVDHSKLTGGYRDPKAGQISFRVYAEDWRARQAHHKPSTAADIERQFRLHVYPHIGARPIAAIYPSDIEAMVKALSRDLTPSTLRVVKTWTAAVFKSAVRNRLIATSPCDGVKVPRLASSATISMLTTEQVIGIAETITPRYRAVVMVGAGTGLRPSELLGLTVDRVDFLRRTIKVDRQLTRDQRLGSLKSESSYRTVPLPETVLAELSRHLSIWPASEEGLVFTNTRGNGLGRVSFGDEWRRARTEIAEWATPHDLRHFYASLLISRGASVKVVQARLGHESATTTLDIYGHLWPDDEDLTRTVVDLEFGSRVTSVSRTSDSTAF